MEANIRGIITVDYEPSTKRGGQERSLFDVVKGFRKEGIPVILAYCVYGDLVPIYESLGVVTVLIPRINIFKKGSITQWKEFYSSITRISKVSPLRPAIYLNQIMDLPLGVGLKYALKAKSLTVHLRLPPVGQALKGRMNQLSLMKHCVDHFIVATTNMQHAHSTSGVPENKIAIIPNGFWFDEMTIPAHAAENNPIKITYLGRIDKSKGVDEIIDALKLVKERGYQFDFSIAGGTMNSTQVAYKRELEDQIERLNLTQEVTFVGHKNDPVEYFTHYDLTIFSSTWNESFGRVLVESIVAGTPVIGKNVGSVAEILNDMELKWIYSSVEDLAQKIIQFMNSKNYEIEQKQNYMLKRYDLNTIIHAIIQLTN